MRFILGMIFGAVMLLGAAYIRDASLDPAREPEARAMVNWEVVSASVRGLSGWAQDEWTWLDRQLRHAA